MIKISGSVYDSTTPLQKTELEIACNETEKTVGAYRLALRQFVIPSRVHWAIQNNLSH